MAQNDNIQLFENKRIRTAWDEEKEEWYFSVVDVVFILEAQHGSVRSVEVAEYMNVSKASVNHAVRHTRNQAHYFE